jgi:hypothetical protein
MNAQMTTVCSECGNAPIEPHPWCRPYCKTQTHPRPCEPISVGIHHYRHHSEIYGREVVTTTEVTAFHGPWVQVVQWDDDYENVANWVACTECGVILESGNPHRPACSHRGGR